MSEPGTAGARKMRLVAVGAALVALVFTLIAVIVVLTRDGEPPKPSTQESPLTDVVVKSTDVVRLRNGVELVVEQGTTKGVRIKDAELAKLLGLAEGDVITAVSGKPMTQEKDAGDVIVRLSLMSATTMYVEVLRKAKPNDKATDKVASSEVTTLVRWKLDGDLRQARYGTSTSGLLGNPFGSPPSTGSASGSATSSLGPYTLDPDDPMFDAIEKIDDTHYKLPRNVVDAMLANPMAAMRGARVVPAIKNGVEDGFKLYAIRPSSVFAKIGFTNGDTVHSINGLALITPDNALEAYTKLKDAKTVNIDITRRGKPIELVIEITK
ncbi:MAG TPA: type II secretion system protein GspC [Kofleriaceae bacterium]